MTDLIWSFSPWFVFLLASRFVSFSGAVGLAFVAAIVVLIRAEHATTSTCWTSSASVISWRWR